MIKSLSSLSSQYTPNARWERKSTVSKGDLLIKKVAIFLIWLINMGAICSFFYYLTIYCHIPDKAFFIAPFVSGVLTAMAFLKLPTGGISNGNYRDLTNPALMLGQIATVALFGPTVIMRNYCDWNDYADQQTALEIIKDLKEKPFIVAVETYGKNLSNLSKYGIVSKADREKMEEIYNKYKKDIETYQLLVRRDPKIKESGEYAADLKTKLQEGQEQWALCISAVSWPTLTHIIPKFSYLERFSLWCSDLCGDLSDRTAPAALTSQKKR